MTTSRRTSFSLVTLLFISLFGYSVGCNSASRPMTTVPISDSAKGFEKVVKSESEWRAQLSTMQFYVTRMKGTEVAFTGEYNSNTESGVYECIGCRLPLFSASHKFDSRSGWPSFWRPYSDSVIAEEMDKSFGMTRIEVLCARCDGHLGHVFDDGPNPTGLRYCINSASLFFRPDSTHPYKRGKK